MPARTRSRRRSGRRGSSTSSMSTRAWGTRSTTTRAPRTTRIRRAARGSTRSTGSSATCARGSGSRRGGHTQIRPRDREEEGAARARGALHPEASAVQLDEALRQREPEARAPLFDASRRGLLELPEDPVAILFGDADPAVPHRDAHLVAAPDGTDVDAALVGRELDRVREEVEE